MRVLHFFKTYLPDTTGGIEQVIFHLCEGSLALGVQAEVLALSPRPEPARILVGRHETRRAQQDLFLASTGFSREVFGIFAEMAAKADLVHFHFPWPAMDLVHFITRHGRPSVVSYHSDIVKQRTLLAVYRPLMRRFLDSVDRILVASPNYQLSSDVLQQFSHKVEIVPYGLNRAAYPSCSAEKLEHWRQRVGSKFFLFVGVLRYYKGLGAALDALSGTAYPLVIIGSGPEEAKLRAQAERLQLRNVQFVGRLDDEDKACLLQLCYALLLPSHLRSEAFGVALLEASMYGKPMISCEIGTGTTFVNIHEETGLAVPPVSPAALRAAMQRLWDNPEEALAFGANAARRFDQLFTAERMCAETMRVYREVIDRKADRA